LSRIVSLSIQFLIVVSLVAFSIGTLPDLPEKTKQWLKIIEIFCVLIFTVEYLLRIYVANKKLKFIFQLFWTGGLTGYFAFLFIVWGRFTLLKILAIYQIVSSV
jgi:voltage-gated potassium channel